MKLCNDATRNEEAVAVSVQGRPVPRPRPINFNLVPKKRRLTCPLTGVAGDAEDVPDPERLFLWKMITLTGVVIVTWTLVTPGDGHVAHT